MKKCLIWLILGSLTGCTSTSPHSDMMPGFMGTSTLSEGAVFLILAGILAVVGFLVYENGK